MKPTVNKLRKTHLPEVLSTRLLYWCSTATVRANLPHGYEFTTIFSSLVCDHKHTEKSSVTFLEANDIFIVKSKNAAQLWANNQNKYEIRKKHRSFLAEFYIIILHPHRLFMLNGSERSEHKPSLLFIHQWCKSLYLLLAIEKPFKLSSRSNNSVSTPGKQSKVYFGKWKYEQKYNSNMALVETPRVT